ncbi:N-acetylglutamate synthase-like GNAT family acetyltransferase [Nakamurella sp. UYEF19]|uniref:GNAT family N-acetyltransferase n=1 Tax=Nakamurella sp. UYEF19 TaxID=1756392 RepID=UPI003390BFA4
MTTEETITRRPDTARAATITVGPMAGPADAEAFRELNEEWITTLFTLEPADRVLLQDPEGEIVAKGGQVLIARSAGDVVGCVALVPAGGGLYELSKMAVSPTVRGQGIGRVIILAAIDHARGLGATSLFLGSSTRLPNAVHLYESVGFVHVAPDSLGPLPYQRADVFMAYSLV